MRENRVGRQRGGDRIENDENDEHEEGATVGDQLAGQ